MGTDSNLPETNDLIDDVDLDSLIDEVTTDAGAEKVSDVQAQAVGAGEVAAVGNVVQLLPVHAAPHVGGKSKGSPLVVKRQRGRPREVERMPTTSDLEYHAKMIEEKAKFVEADSVVQAALRQADPMQMLAVVRTEVAKESAALHFQRIENEKFGKDTAQVSSRRIDALKKIADIELEIKKLGAETIDVHSEKMLRIFRYFIDTVRSILEENLSPEQIDLIFNRLTTEFEGWQEKLSDVLR